MGLPSVQGQRMDQRYNLLAWRALASVCATGSLTAAAEALETDPSHISRLIAGLEKALGREFLVRGKHPARITDEARATVARVKPILKAHHAFLAHLAQDNSRMQGTIRLSVAGGLLHDKLMPMLAQFQALYPGIDFDVRSAQRLEQCLSGEIDVASVSSAVTLPELVSLARGRSVFVPVASPAYLAKNGVPLRPEDCVGHTGFVYTGPVRTPTQTLVLHGQERPVRFARTLTATDILMIKRAVLDARGIAVDMPVLHCAQEIAQGSLQVILQGWHRPPLAAYTVCSKAAWHVRRIRVFMQFYTEQFQHIFADSERLLTDTLGDAADVYFE